jgi:hypothetical protein
VGWGVQTSAKQPGLLYLFFSYGLTQGMQLEGKRHLSHHKLTRKSRKTASQSESLKKNEPATNLSFKNPTKSLYILPTS